MASKAAVQTAQLLSIRGLRRRRLGHIGPNFYDPTRDKWGHKKTGGAPNLLALGGKKVPPPRASLVLGQDHPTKKRNGLNGSPPQNHMNGNGFMGIQKAHLFGTKRPKASCSL